MSDRKSRIIQRAGATAGAVVAFGAVAAGAAAAAEAEPQAVSGATVEAHSALAHVLDRVADEDTAVGPLQDHAR